MYRKHSVQSLYKPPRCRPIACVGIRCITGAGLVLGAFCEARGGVAVCRYWTYPGVHCSTTRARGRASLWSSTAGTHSPAPRFSTVRPSVRLNSGTLPGWTASTTYTKLTLLLKMKPKEHCIPAVCLPVLPSSLIDLRRYKWRRSAALKHVGWLRCGTGCRRRWSVVRASTGYLTKNCDVSRGGVGIVYPFPRSVGGLDGRGHSGAENTARCRPLWWIVSVADGVINCSWLNTEPQWDWPGRNPGNAVRFCE